MTTTDRDIQRRPLPKCRNCTVPMEPGFQIEHNPGITQATWVPGEPVPPGFWIRVEVTRDQLKEALRVVSFRCPECGLLDCYANDPVKPS